MFSTTEKWKESIDQSLIFGDFLIDLSIALDCFSHEIMIAKTAWKVSVFSCIRTEYGEILRIQFECGKIWTRKFRICTLFTQCKLHDYGLDILSLRLMCSYLINRKQMVKTNNTYNLWSKILFGVPQGSILGPFLFNTHICYLFFFVSNVNIANYVDYNTPYSAKKRAHECIKWPRTRFWYFIKLVQREILKS